jgi:hypothetical protein
MSDHDHDEIARRLRESGTVPAPEGLRAEVMAQVRAEPRRRSGRRSFLVPVLPYAAAAAALVVVVIAVTHLSGSGSYSGSAGEGASGGAAATGDVAQPSLVPKDSAGGSPNHSPAPQNAIAARAFRIPGRYVMSLAPARTTDNASPYPRVVVLVVPRPLFAAYVSRLKLIERRSHGTGSVRVVLRPSPAP